MARIVRELQSSYTVPSCNASWWTFMTEIHLPYRTCMTSRGERRGAQAVMLTQMVARLALAAAAPRRQSCLMSRYLVIACSHLCHLGCAIRFWHVYGFVPLGSAIRFWPVYLVVPLSCAIGFWLMIMHARELCLCSLSMGFPWVLAGDYACWTAALRYTVCKQDRRMTYT